MDLNKLKDDDLYYVMVNYILPQKKFDINDFKTREEFLKASNGFEKFNQLTEEERSLYLDLFLTEDRIKLHIELIPKNAWGINLRTKLKKSDWDKIRKAVYVKENMHCHICCEECKSLDAHEIWEWDEENHIQRLVDIIGICKACHNTIHYGRACQIGTQKQAKEHFMKVNQCDEREWMYESMQAQTDALRRSEIPSWKLDLSFIEKQGYKINIE